MIIQIIKKVRNLHPYRIIGKKETYSDYNRGWEDACNAIEGEIGNQLLQNIKICPDCKQPINPIYLCTKCTQNRMNTSQ